MNKSDVVDVLTAVQAGDRRTVGEGDVEMWFLVMGEVPKEFALKAVVDHFREKPGVWLEPGYILQRWKDYRRDQYERSDAIREAHQAQLDSRFAAVAELAEAKAIPPPELKYKRREGPNALEVACPWCKASAGNPCCIPKTSITTKPHPSRIEALEATA